MSFCTKEKRWKINSWFNILKMKASMQHIKCTLERATNRCHHHLVQTPHTFGWSTRLVMVTGRRIHTNIYTSAAIVTHKWPTTKHTGVTTLRTTTQRVSLSNVSPKDGNKYLTFWWDESEQTSEYVNIWVSEKSPPKNIYSRKLTLAVLVVCVSLVTIFRSKTQLV